MPAIHFGVSPATIATDDCSIELVLRDGASYWPAGEYTYHYYADGQSVRVVPRALLDTKEQFLGPR